VLFHSNIFILYFFPLTLLLFFISNKIRFDSKIILILASLFFYSWWNINYLPLIILSILINFFLGKKIQKSQINKKKILLISILFNIGLLFSFKYADFFISNYNFLTNSEINKLNLPFPLGISFYTFQVITYLVDCYYGKIILHKFKNFALFVVFFPQLIAGPIIKYNFLIDQLNVSKFFVLRINNILKGLILFIIGFIKKVFFADQLSLIVDSGYLNYQNLNFLDSWLTSLAFTFQIYFDFSGYVDMALGCALMLNIILPINFNSPYKAHNVIHFWKKWHITWAEFLMNYIYYPLLRSLPNISFPLVMLVTIIVFFLAGLWHGPSWMFIAFGLIHGIGVVFNHCKEKFFNFKVFLPLSIFLTFNYINFSFVIFRSENFEQAFVIISRMLNFNSFNVSMFNNVFSDPDLFKNMVLLILSIFIVFMFKNSDILINSKYLK
jgi:D-alanyl-lipoteichoic acid acyltransferase DltB (MBOAT superfamily)